MKYSFFSRGRRELPKAPEPEMTLWRQLWQLLWVVLSGLGLGAVSLLLAIGPYPLALLHGYLESPLLLYLNLAPVVALALLGYGLFRSPHRGFVFAAVLTLGFSVGSYFKLFFRDDPLMMADLFLLKEAGNMAGNYRLFLDWYLAIALFCVLGGYLFLRLFVRRRLPKGSRPRHVTVLLGCTLALLLTPSILSDSLYDGKGARYQYLENQWSATQQYIAHGFVYPFLHSAVDAVDLPPQDYDKDSAQALLEQYTDADIPGDKKVNVIGIMLEGYNDFTKFDIPDLSPQVYEVWHQLEAEGVAGDLVTNIFAGGTVDTERCFLTGYSELKNYRGAVNAYPWYFQSQGYTVEGMHPCFQWFYNRLNINQYMGFENYYFVENYFESLVGNTTAPDRIFFPELLKTYREKTADGSPYFTFSVTYQGHGPYASEGYYWGGEPPVPPSDRYTPEQRNILNNYLGSIRDTNQYLKEFTDALRKDDTPVVLVLFGDHNPWMGDGNSVYQALGVNFDMNTAEGFTNYYGTRYIIWANDAAKEALGRDFSGEGPTISPSFLMNELFRQCGWTGPAYLQATNEVMDQVGVINIPTGLYMEQGQLTDVLSAEGAALVKSYHDLQYYVQKEFFYGE